MGDFSHLSTSGKAKMVDVGKKVPSHRMAQVSGLVQINSVCAAQIDQEAADEICRTASFAGIQAAKQTPQLIPLCHQINLQSVDIDIIFEKPAHRFRITAFTSSQAVTGVEMEALTAAVIAGATIYDMIKAVDPSATVGPFNLLEKTGGKNRTWHNRSAN